jgi:hypothetical protein
MPTNNETDTKLKGLSAWVGKILWVAVAIFCLAYFVATWYITLQQPLPNCQNAIPSCNPIYLSENDMAVVENGRFTIRWVPTLLLGANALSNAAFLVAAFLIFWRKSNDWVALLVSGTMIGLGAIGFSPDLTEFLAELPWLYWPINLLSQASYILPVTMLFFFPDGRFIPSSSRVLILVLILIALYEPLSRLITARPTSSLYFFIFAVIFSITTIIGIGSVVYRYRQIANHKQKQQLKWVALGFLGAVAIVVSWSFFAIVYPPERPLPERTLAVILGQIILMPVTAVFPISVMIAILRYQLFDIDTLIRRTLTYTLLTGLLAMLYFGSIIILQGFSGSIFGEQSSLVIVISTLAIAFLFNPLRYSVQNFIDRRFYRQKYDAAQTLAFFAGTARDEVELEALAAELVRVVQETMQPSTMSFWLQGTRDQSHVNKYRDRHTIRND